MKLSGPPQISYLAIPKNTVYHIKSQTKNQFRIGEALKNIHRLIGKLYT